AIIVVDSGSFSRQPHLPSLTERRLSRQRQRSLPAGVQRLSGQRQRSLPAGVQRLSGQRQRSLPAGVHRGGPARECSPQDLPVLTWW
ncbi:hypothetical protein AAFF_G00376560, partial [Aldrovandia affinis]